MKNSISLKYIKSLSQLALASMFFVSALVCADEDNNRQDIASLVAATNSDSGTNTARLNSQVVNTMSQSQASGNTSVRAVRSPSTSAANTVDSVNSQAFANVPESLMPLSPNQIKEIRRRYNSTQQAGAYVQDVPAKPVSSTVEVSLDPGSSPPVVRLSSGFISSLVFLDSTGAPWPIKAYDLGDPKSYNVQWSNSNPDKPGSNANTLLIQAITLYKVANLAVILEGLNTPIMLTLIPGQEAVDYRVDLRCPGLGPLAKPSYNFLPSSANSSLVDIINGVIPQNAKKLTVSQSGVEAWAVGKKMFVRTPMNIISPSWISSMTGSEGSVNAYEMPQSSVLLGLSHGKVHQLKVEGF